MSTTQQALNISDQAERRTRYLYWWLLLAFAFEYARPGYFVPGIGALKLNSLIPLGLLGVSIIAKNLRPARDIAADALSKWMLVYVALIFLSLTHAEVTVYTFDKCITVLGYLFMYWFTARIATSPKRLRGIVVTLAGAHVFLLIMNPDVVLDPTSRDGILGASFIGDGNDWSLSLCILVPLMIDVITAAKSKWWRLTSIVVSSVLLLSIIGTMSRGGTLALIAVAAYLWWKLPHKVLVLCIVGVVALGVLAYASDMYMERMGSIANYAQDGSAQGRIIAWNGAIRMAIDSPLLGVGAGQFPTSFGANYLSPEDAGFSNWITAHSMYFLVLGELGLPGIITLLVLVFGNMRANTRVRNMLTQGRDSTDMSVRSADLARLLLLLNAGIIGFAVAGAFLSVAYYPHVFVITALCVAARHMAKAQIKDAPAKLRTTFEPAASYGSRRPAAANGLQRNAQSFYSPRRARS